MAQAIPFTTGTSPDLLNVAIQKIWLKVKPFVEDFYKRYVNVVTGVTDYYTKDSSLSGMGEMSRILDNATIQAESPIEGYDQTYTQVHYGKLLRVSKMMWFFGIKKRDLTRITTEVKRTCMSGRERIVADRVDNMFSTSYTKNDDAGNYSVTTTGGNSVALVSNAQTREDSGTNNNNRITDGTTVNFDFAYDAVKASHYTLSPLSPLKDAKGNPFNATPTQFIFTKGSPESFIAQEILGAIRRAHKPGSSEYDGSGVPAFKTVELPWITTNTSYWACQDESLINDEYGIQFLESQPIKLEGPNIVFTTKEVQYTSTTLFALGHNDSRGTGGSKNTNAA